MKSKNAYLEKEINCLDIDDDIMNILINNNITTIGMLWECNKKTLKEYGLKDSSIKQISIKLQLLGLDLNKKVYKI